MKSLLLTVLAACALTFSIRADIPAPQPTFITVTNLAAFPKYKFSYVAADGRPAAKPIADGKAFGSLHDVELFAQSGSDAPQPWAKIKHEWRGQKITIVVEDVRQRDKTITVTYKTTDGHAPPSKKSASALPESLPHFLLAGLGTCGLVLLARRGRKTP